MTRNQRRLTLLRRIACAFAFIALVVALAPARADDVETVKEKLFQAKKEYDGETRKFRAAVTEALDKREEAARKAGDKKALDAIKAERDRYDKDGELPTATPAAALTQVRAARATLDKAYTAAVKDYTRLREDAAEAAEKGQQEFNLNAAVAFGKRTYVTTLKVSEIKVWNNFFEVNSKKAVMEGKVVPNSVLMHPDVRTYANASFTLNSRPVAFGVTVGTPKHDPTLGDPASALTFEVLGDGKTLWKSEPVEKVATFQSCIVKIDKAKTLTLRIHCRDERGGAHAAWFAPFIVE